MFGRKKMYKKGMEDALQANEAFSKKQEEALNHVREEVRAGTKCMENGLAELNENLDGIYDLLNSQEKAALYRIYTPMDIKELPDEEKRFLLAILYQLADDEGDGVTADQQAYIRSVQRYLEISNPQTEAELSAVENIDSIEIQKAFLQVVLEFLYLQDSCSLSDSQEKFIGCFSVNKKQAELIEARVSRLYNAVGAQGLAEKYGFVPEEEPVNVVNIDNSMELLNSTETDSAFCPFISEISDELSNKIATFIFDHENPTLETKRYFVCYSFGFLTELEKGIYVISKETGSATFLCTKKDYPDLVDDAQNIMHLIDYERDIFDVSGMKGYWRINASKKEIKLLYTIKGKKEEVIAANQELLIIRMYPQTFSYNLSTEKKFILFENDGNGYAHISNLCTEDALYFNGGYPGKMQKYVFANQKVESIVTLTNGGLNDAHDIALYNGTLFWCDYGGNLSHFYCANLNDGLSPSHIGSAYVKGVYVFNDGYLIICETEYYFLSFTSKQMTKLVDCEYSLPFRIGRYVYFKKGQFKARTLIDNPSNVELL